MTRKTAMVCSSFYIKLKLIINSFVAFHYLILIFFVVAQ